MVQPAQLLDFCCSGLVSSGTQDSQGTENAEVNPALTGLTLHSHFWDLSCQFLRK